MARYEHLPIFRAAFDLAVHFEKIVRNFSRYHKYSLGTELRDQSRRVLTTIIDANNAREKRYEILQGLRLQLEQLQVLIRLCHESGGFASTRAYIFVSEQVQAIAKQNEGWLRSSKKSPGKTSPKKRKRSPSARSGKSSPSQNRLF